MTSKPLKATLDEQLAGITINEQLEKRIMALPNAARKAKRRSMTAIVACGLLLIALPVLAATNPSFQALLSQVGDKIAQLLQPIELVSESSGIRMEVVAAMNDDSNAIAYITLQDMTGDRLAGVIDLYQYGMSETGMSYTPTALYDEETRTATLRMFSYRGKNLNEKKVTLSLQSFLTGRKEWESVDIGFPLDTVQVAERTVWLENLGLGGGGNFDEIIINGGLEILPLDEMYIPIPGVDFAYISNIGLIDGRLHIQIHWTEKGNVPANLDDHGYVWLVGNDGQPLLGDGSDVSVDFCVDAQGVMRNTVYGADGLLRDGGTAYQEEVFVVDSNLENYTLQGYFCTNKAYITGDWSVTFQLQAVKAFKQADCNIDIGTARIRKITVSPIGWTILGEKQPDSTVQAEVLVKMTDGIEQRFEVSCLLDDEISFECNFFEEEPLDIERIKEVYVNGQAVRLVEKQ